MSAKPTNASVKSYVVALFEGRRVIVPLDDVSITITHDLAPVWSAASPFPLHVGVVMRVNVVGVASSYTIWETGDNPEAYVQERAAITNPMLEVEA